MALPFRFRRDTARTWFDASLPQYFVTLVFSRRPVEITLNFSSDTTIGSTKVHSIKYRIE